MFGVWAPGEEVAKLTYFGLYALQHRGQESAGIAVSNGETIVVVKDMGLVPQVFDEAALNTLRGHLAIGHCRYSTTGASVWENAQPTFRATPSASLALGAQRQPDQHQASWPRWSTRRPGPAGPGGDQRHRRPDRAVRRGRRGPAAGRDGPGSATIEESALAALPLVRGAYSLVFMDERTLYAARDPQGFRPLVLGRLANGLGRGQRDRRAGHRRRHAGPRGRARRADRDRRGRGPVPAVRRARAARLPVRVRVPGPAGHHDRRARACRPPGWRSAASWPPSTRSRRTW